MKPNMELINQQFGSYTTDHWIRMLDVRMEQNKHLIGSDWYKRLEETKTRLENGDIDDSVKLSIAMALVGL